MVSTKDNDSKRIYEIDFIKVTCCILVIVIHSACDFLPKPLMNCLDALTATAVPGFMMISGYLLFFTSEKEYKRIIKVPLLKFSIIFLIWYLFYVFENYRLDTSTDLMSLMVNNSEGWHLWYIKIYIELLICYPIIRCITNNKYAVKLYLIFWMIFIGTKYSLDLLSGFKISSSWFKILSLPFFEYDGYIGGTTAGYHPAECVGIFIMGGYFITQYLKRKGNWKLKNDVVVIAIALILIKIIMLFQDRAESIGFPVDMVRSPFHVYVVIFTMAYIYCGFRIGSFFEEKIGGIVRKLSENCLGVYIIHPYVQRRSVSVITKFVDINHWMTGGIIFISTVVLSFLIVFLVHKAVPQRIVKYIF